MITAEELVKITREHQEEELRELLSKMEAHAKTGKLGYPVKFLNPYTKTKLEEMGFELKSPIIPGMMYTIWWGD